MNTALSDKKLCCHCWPKHGDTATTFRQFFSLLLVNG